MKAKLFRERCCCSMYGISISIPRRTSSTSMSAASAARLTVSKPIRLSTPFAESGTVYVLLAKTLRSSTFKLALICIGIFGAVVVALFGYVYWSTASYVRIRSDQAIKTELVNLQEAFASTGRSGLISAIAQREGGVYLLADSSFIPLAGNLEVWPPALKASNRWAT